MAERRAVVDEWSRESQILPDDVVQALAATFCALSLLSGILFVVYVVVFFGKKKPFLHSCGIVGLTVGVALVVPAAGLRARDPTAVYTDSWAVCILFYVGDLLAHWGILATILHVYSQACRRCFVLHTGRGDLLASRFRTVVKIVAALQPFTIGCVTAAGLPGVSDSMRKLGVQIFWVVQISGLFGLMIIYEAVPATRSILQFKSELAEETPSGLRREICWLGRAMLFFTSVLVLDVGVGVAMAFWPPLYKASGMIYYYYILNMSSLVAIGAMTFEFFGHWAARRTASKISSFKAPDTALPQNTAKDALEAGVAGIKEAKSRLQATDSKSSNPSADAISPCSSVALGPCASTAEMQNAPVAPMWERGITLELLEGLADGWCITEERNLTTENVCHMFVTVATIEIKTSLWEALKASCDEDPEGSLLLPHLRKPTVFVSHCWAGLFLDILSIMRCYNKKSQRCNAFWFDVVSMNQHDLLEVKNTKSIDQENLGHTMISNLQRSIATPGRMLLAMTPHDGPLLLQRAWCLFEMHVGYEIKAKIACGFTEEAEAAVIQSLRNDPQFLESLLDSVDASQAKATVEADRVMILKLIEKSGMLQFNKFIRTRFKSTLSLLMADTSGADGDAGRVD